MDGGGGGGGSRRRWPSWNNLKRRLGFKRINILGFCGSSKWDNNNNINNNDNDINNANAGEQPLMFSGDQSPAAWETVSLAGDGDVTVNLATALAAERRQINVTVKPLKTIVQLFEEIDGRDVVVKVVDDGGDDVSGGGIGRVCCLCTERSKGAALIPCGHTYCRVCCGVMWRKREACPLCNRSIMDVLEIL